MYKRQGIPFVLVDSPVEGSSPLTTISKDFDEQARLLLADIEEKLGKNKMLRIGIQVSDLSFDLARDQIASIEAVFAQHPGGFEIVAKSESRSDQLTSRNEWIKVLDVYKRQGSEYYHGVSDVLCHFDGVGKSAVGYSVFRCRSTC